MTFSARWLRWTLPVVTLAFALAFWARSAHATEYWVETYYSASTSGCYYTPSSYGAYAIVVNGSDNSSSCQSIVLGPGATGYAECGTTQPSYVSVQLGYLDGSGNFNLYGTCYQYQQSWSSGAVTPSCIGYNSSGTTSGCSGARVTGYAYGVSNP
jgi:hypothetical protein